MQIDTKPIRLLQTTDSASGLALPGHCLRSRGKYSDGKQKKNPSATAVPVRRLEQTARARHANRLRGHPR